MRWSLITLACLGLGSGLVSAQQPFQNPPAGPNQHAIQRQGASRDPAAQQRFQDALRARATRGQFAFPNTDVNNRNPLRQVIPPDPRDAAAGGLPTHDGLLDEGLLYDNSYSSGGGGGVVTAQHGALLGTAEVLRGAGQLSKDTASAAVLHEHAREKAIDNRYDAVNTYFEVRQLNRRYRAQERGPTPTLEDMLRYTRAGLPERLPITALDRDTGVVHWPAALMRPEFAEHRAHLEQIFQGRSYYNSGVASESYLEIREETDRMLATLQSLVHEMDPTAYMQARKFITSLGFEGQFVVGADRVAMKG
jgi:hypothetical protein